MASHLPPFLPPPTLSKCCEGFRRSLGHWGCVADRSFFFVLVSPLEQEAIIGLLFLLERL